MALKEHHADVIIVGGGPAGASTAHYLLAKGARVSILDRARFPRPKPCAEYLSPQASRLLDDMGVLDTLERTGAEQLAGMIVRTPAGALIRGDFVASHGYSAFRNRGLAVRRTVLDHILLTRAREAGADVREGVRVADLVREPGGRVTGVRTANGETLAAGMVIGADGLRSVIARRSGLAHTSRWWERRIAIVAHYEGFEGVGDWGELHVERGVGYVGFASVGNGITNVSLVVPASRGREVSKLGDTFVDQWLAARPQLAPRVAHARRLGRPLVTGPFASHAVRPYDKGMALVGDAADFFDPFTGEGVYAALRGGEMLAPQVIAALGASSERSARDAMRVYEAARRREFGGKWIVERLINAAIRHAPVVNYFGRTLSRRRDMADLLVGVTGDFVPAREVLRPGYLLSLFRQPSDKQLAPPA